MRNTTPNPTPQTVRNSSTACPSWSITSRRSFAAYSDYLFYFTVTVLFCWVGFWETAALDFPAYYPVTYFVLYVSLMLLIRMSGIA